MTAVWPMRVLQLHLYGKWSLILTQSTRGPEDQRARRQPSGPLLECGERRQDTRRSSRSVFRGWYPPRGMDNVEPRMTALRPIKTSRGIQKGKRGPARGPDPGALRPGAVGRLGSVGGAVRAVRAHAHVDLAGVALVVLVEA